MRFQHRLGILNQHLSQDFIAFPFWQELFSIKGRPRKRSRPHTFRNDDERVTWGTEDHRNATAPIILSSY
jgi:hypothetical protein